MAGPLVYGLAGLLACPSLHRWRPARTRGTRWLQRNAPEWFQIHSDWLFRDPVPVFACVCGWVSVVCGPWWGAFLMTHLGLGRTVLCIDLQGSVLTDLAAPFGCLGLWWMRGILC